jgi:hypothetical protein
MRRISRIFLYFLFILQVILLVLLSYQTCFNRTEVGHVGAAVYFYKAFRYDVFHVNPPFTRYIVGLPIICTNPKYDWRSYSHRPQDRCEWPVGHTFIDANSPEKIRWCIFLARCSLIPIILVGGWFGYRFAFELYGEVSGFIFLIFWVFSPLILGWGATICPDVCASSLGIVGVYMFWRWLKKPCWRGVIKAGICLGLLPLVKLTWVIAFVLWIFIWLVWTLPYLVSGKKTMEVVSNIPKLRQLVVILVIGLYVLNMGYAFDGTFRILKDYTFISKTLSGAEFKGGNNISGSNNRFAKTLLGYVPVPLPAEFVQGIDTQKLDFERGIESYLCGEYSKRGWWYYFVYVILIREPLANLCLCILALIVTLFFKGYNSVWRDEAVIILTGFSLFIFISSQTGFSLHPRYIILVLPFVYIWVSKIGKLFLQRRYILSAVVMCLLFWTVVSSLCSFPHSMSYFNELIGGAQNAPKHLLGSNIDWGQNSYFFQKWYNKHQQSRPIKIFNIGSESPERLGIVNAEKLPDQPEAGWFAISVNEIYGSSKQYEYFKRFEPTDMIGKSIYIYNITLSEANRVRREMNLPEITDQTR